MEAEKMSGQEGIKTLNTTNAVTEAGILVRPQEPVVIVGSEQSKHLATGSEHTVHRILAEKLVDKGQATYKNKEDEPKKKEGKK